MAFCGERRDVVRLVVRGLKKAESTPSGCVFIVSVPFA